MPKTGFVALIGRPNSGKSTLLNLLVGEKIAIVSDKPQTTRNRVLGVRNQPGCQMVFVDTPGVHRPGFRMNERMMETVYEALREVDLLVHLVDASERFGKGEQYVLDLVKRADKPAILALNKIDLISKGKVLPMIEFFSRQHSYADIVPISALRADNIEALLGSIAAGLPDGDYLYPPDYLTDQTERFLASEIIREKLLSHTREELPYATAVKIEGFDEALRSEGFVRISASIIVDKDTQKKIVIGRGGQMIKTIGTEARKELERFLSVRRIYLELNVSVVPGWRNVDYLLDEMSCGEPQLPSPESAPASAPPADPEQEA
jgi:GTP-binding protein Era